MKKTALTVALTALIGVGAMSAQAAVLNSGDVLTIDDGAYNTDAYGNPLSVASGSWFGMDTNGDGKVQGTEQTVIDGLNGVTIGSTQGSNDIDQWMFFGAPGTHYTTVAPTGDTTNGLDFSGWTVNWGAVPTIPMGSGAWTPSNCGASWMGCGSVTFGEGTAAIAWDGVYGSTYSLWYSATVPVGDPSGFGGVAYIVRLTGTVTEGGGTPEIPVPAAAWLLGSGLMGLVGVARRKGKKA